MPEMVDEEIVPKQIEDKEIERIAVQIDMEERSEIVVEQTQRLDEYGGKVANRESETEQKEGKEVVVELKRMEEVEIEKIVFRMNLDDGREIVVEQARSGDKDSEDGESFESEERKNSIEIKVQQEEIVNGGEEDESSDRPMEEDEHELETSVGMERPKKVNGEDEIEGRDEEEMERMDGEQMALNEMNENVLGKTQMADGKRDEQARFGGDGRKRSIELEEPQENEIEEYEEGGEMEGEDEQTQATKVGMKKMKIVVSEDEREKKDERGEKDEIEWAERDDLGEKDENEIVEKDERGEKDEREKERDGRKMERKMRLNG